MQFPKHIALCRIHYTASLATNAQGYASGLRRGEEGTRDDGKCAKIIHQYCHFRFKPALTAPGLYFVKKSSCACVIPFFN